MSLGLFNCRLIQPAGDQLFFLSAPLPRCCQFRQALFSLLVTRLLGPDQREGAECFLFFPLRKILFWFSEEAKARLVQRASLLPIHPRIPQMIPNPTHRFCYTAGFYNEAK
jgi:hypothetical protein